MRSIICSDANQTVEYGRKLGAQLKGGEVIRLIGDIGGGKTTFVRGLVAGIDSPNQASSPTFTIHNLYKGRILLYHYDFYRVQGDPAVEQELAEIIREGAASVVLEWPEYSKLSLPAETIDIKFKVVKDDRRELLIVVPKRLNYIKL